MGRHERAYEVANSAAKRVFEFLAPDYVMARDQLNVTKVADLGGMLIGRFGLMHGAMAALEEIRPTLPHNSVSGVGADQSQEEFQRCETIERRMPALQQRIQQADAMIASALTPHQFRHEEVAGRRVVLELAGTFEQQNAILTAELQRTIELLQTTRELIVILTTRKRGLDPATVDKARGELARWSGRPLDLAFMRAALGPLWTVLDTAAGGPLSAKPGDLMTKATRQVEETGWLGDAGRFDIDAACEQLYVGGRLMAELVIGDLNTADPNTRAKLLVQIQERGLLHQLCSAVGWEQIKDLHDHLGYGFPQIKHALRPYFIGTDKFGPSPDREWEHHDRSAHAAISRWGHIGYGVNVALDVTTFGFHSSYGQALDERAQGVTSESEASNAKAHAAMRTAVTTIVSTLSAGVADKAVRGGAATVSTGRALAGGAAAGSLGAGTTVATSDAYNNYIAGTQHGASSMQDYVTAMLLGGGIGAGFGALANRSSRRSAARAPDDAPVAEPPLVGPYREPSPPLAAASEKAGFDLRALQAPQRDLLDVGEASLVSGDHYAAVKQFDQLVASGVPKHSVDTLEAELARALGKTAPSVYRNPKAILPNGKEIPPTVYGGELFHGTSEIPPEVAFEKGLPGRGGNTKLLDHILQPGDSAFRGTTTYISPEGRTGAAAWATEEGWVYKIDGTPSWDLNAELQGRVPKPDGTFGNNPMPGEHEQAVLANIPRERIIGAMKISERGHRLVYGEMIANPNYRAPQ
jgi:hypothetical protein